MKLGPNQQKWVDALRSGKYKQIKGKLKTTSGHCCLGVGCEIFKDELDLKEKKEATVYTFDGTGVELPQKVMDHILILSQSGTPKKRGRSLVYFNDDAGKSFSEIADIIEDNAEYYFKESK